MEERIEELAWKEGVPGNASGTGKKCLGKLELKGRTVYGCWGESCNNTGTDVIDQPPDPPWGRRGLRWDFG
jgi:hypothetical protein